MKEEVQLDELSNDKLADYKKKAGENASAADKAGDTKKGNKRFSGIMKATRKQFDNDAKQKTEELSPKQKALDKNKNGKIDGSDLAKLRGEELSPAQKAIDKNKNGKIDGSDLAHLRSKKKQPQGADFAAQRRKERMASTGRMDEAKSDYEIYHKDYSGAVQTAIKQAEKRGFEVDMDDWHDKVATGPKKPSSGKTNSFSINLMKDGKPSKKKLQMQVYNMDNQKYELNMYIESVEEASSPAQQAAIAIAMKKAGKKPKDMEESDAYDKNVKPSNKPHDKEAAAKRAKIAALFARKKMIKNESKDNKETTANDKKKSIKQGDKLSGKQEPITINPDLNQVK
jgi:Ca2+-binding EF-hand superfamily protein